jgi:hypothetical protein
LLTSNGTQGVMVFSCQIKVRSTQQFTISKCAKRLLPLHPPQGGGQQPPPVSPSESSPSASTLCVRRAGGQPPPVSPSVRGTIEGLFFLRISLGKPAVRKHGVRVAGRGQFSSPLRAFYALYPPERSKTRTPRSRARRWLSGTNSRLHFSINVQDCSVLRMHMLLCRRRY